MFKLLISNQCGVQRVQQMVFPLLYSKRDRDPYLTIISLNFFDDVFENVSENEKLLL